MSKSELENYLHQMQMSGCWGDGIMLSIAARLYGRPVEIVLADGSVSFVDTGNIGIVSSSMEPIRLGLIGNHYVSIQDSAEFDEIRDITPTMHSQRSRMRHWYRKPKHHYNSLSWLHNRSTRYFVSLVHFNVDLCQFTYLLSLLKRLCTCG